MLTLLRWSCTLIGLLVLLLYIAFKTQFLWLNASVEYWIQSSGGYRWSCEKIHIPGQWPLVIKAEKIEIRYPEAESDALFIKAPTVEIHFDRSLFKKSSLQIQKAIATIESIHILKSKKPKREADRASTTTATSSSLPFQIQSLDLSLERLVTSSLDAPSRPPEVFTLNLKVNDRGPLNSFREIRNAILPAFIIDRSGTNW